MLAVAGIVVAGAVRAQPLNYPDRPVRIISDAAPGGAIDTNLRIITESLSKKWAQQVVIENRPGAGGAISATAAAEAPPDGYTLYAPALSVFLTIPGKAPNLPLKLPRDFTAIGITAVQPMSIGINPKLGINSLPELIAQAKKEPGSISYAATGVGRLTHLTGELLQIRGNIKLQMVPYSGGSAQSLADVTAGRVSLVIEGYAGLAGAYASGQLKALAVASEKRLPHVPDLPTATKLAEAVIAYREALKERTRERVPLDWAMSFGNEGIALMLLAERRGDAAMAVTALSQITMALETMRGGGNAPSAARYERQLPKARAVVARLRGR